MPATTEKEREGLVLINAISLRFRCLLSLIVLLSADSLLPPCPQPQRRARTSSDLSLSPVCLWTVVWCFFTSFPSITIAMNERSKIFHHAASRWSLLAMLDHADREDRDRQATSHQFLLFVMLRSNASSMQFNNVIVGEFGQRFRLSIWISIYYSLR